MRLADERRLTLSNSQGLRSFCTLCWRHTLTRVGLRRDTIKKHLFGAVRPGFKRWFEKVGLARVWGYSMSRSSQDKSEDSSNMDEATIGSDVDTIITHKTELYVPVKNTQWPIIYRPEYNIGFLGLERLHPFDAGKWGRVYSFLKEEGMIRDDTIVQPKEATLEDLMVVHSDKYINSLKWSMTVAQITEVPPVAILPNFIVQRKVLRPFRYQTGGTILAAKLAMDRGWGINLGGGFHHCSAERGGGFCAYADITLAIKFLFQKNPKVKKAMIIDLDAHQGNGHERDFMDDTSVYIMDVYNRGIYPHDGYAKRAIKRRVELDSYTEDAEYLDLVKRNVEEALNEFTPDIIVYNAGTDILDGDPLGTLSISPQGIVERDQIVFENAVKRNIPIMMVTSGGYQRTTARIIADSIKNLKAKKLIACEEAENAPSPSGLLKAEKPNEYIPTMDCASGQKAKSRTLTEKESLPSRGIPRSNSESGLFSKLRNFCFSKSPTQEHIPRLPGPSAKPFQDLPTVKSASDLNLNVPAGETNSQSKSQESAIDALSSRYPEENFIERLGMDFMEHKLHSKVPVEDPSRVKLMPNRDTDETSIKLMPNRNTDETSVSLLGISFTDEITNQGSSRPNPETYLKTDKIDSSHRGARPKTSHVTEKLQTQKLDLTENEGENVKTTLSDKESLGTEKVTETETKDEHITETTAFHHDDPPNIEMVTSSDVYNNNVLITQLERISESESTGGNHKEKTQKMDKLEEPYSMTYDTGSTVDHISQEKNEYVEFGKKNGDKDCNNGNIYEKIKLEALDNGTIDKRSRADQTTQDTNKLTGFGNKSDNTVFSEMLKEASTDNETGGRRSKVDHDTQERGTIGASDSVSRDDGCVMEECTQKIDTFGESGNGVCDSDNEWSDFVEYDPNKLT